MQETMPAVAYYRMSSDKQEASIGELFIDVEYRAKCGPVELPKSATINPLDRRSARMPSSER